MVHTALEAAFLRLLAECCGRVSPVRRHKFKWVHVRKNQGELRPIRDDAGAILLGMVMAEGRYRGLPSYQACKDLYDNDEVFKYAASLAGHWGQFNGSLCDIAAKAGTIRHGRIRFDQARVVNILDNLREHYASSSFNYQCVARIYGIGLGRSPCCAQTRSRLFQGCDSVLPAVSGMAFGRLGEVGADFEPEVVRETEHLPDPASRAGLNPRVACGSSS